MSLPKRSEAPPSVGGYPSNSDSVAQDQLRAFVERVERIESDVKDLNSDKSEIYAEAKGNGFDVKVLKKVISIRRQDHAERMEQEAILELYLAALGMQAAPLEDDYDEPASRAPARAREIIEEMPPETATQSTAARTDVPVATGGASALDASSAVEVEPAGTQAPPVDTPKKRWTFTDKPHGDCLDPERCGGFSNLKLCQRCQEAAA